MPPLTRTIPIKAFIAISVAFVAVLLFSPGLNAPFVTTGEPREAVVAQSMILHKDLLQSVRYDHDLATKPPLLHWSMVAVSTVLGELNEISARLPSLIAAVVAMVFWFLFILPIVGQNRAILALAVLATTAEWWRHASHARVDMLLAACVTCSLIALYHWIRTNKTSFLGIALVPLALGALTKGPIGIALPALIAFVALLWWRKLNFRTFLQLCIAAFIAICPLFLWYLAESWVSEGNLFDVVLHENLDRLFGTMSQGDDPHTHGPIYLLGSFIAGLLPWSLIAIFAAPQFYNSWKETTDSDLKRLMEWCLLAVAVTFLFFLIPSSKRGVYLLPIYPAVSTLVAISISNFSVKYLKGTQRIIVTGGLILCTAYIGILLFRLGFLDPQIIISSTKKLERANFYSELFHIDLNSTSLGMWFVYLLPVIVALVTLFGLKVDASSAFLRLAIMTGFFFVYAKLLFIVPASNSLSPRDFIAMELEDHNPSEVALNSIRMYAEVFYLRKLRPNLRVKDFTGKETNLLLWEGDESQIKDDVVYTHVSPNSVEKPEKHLEFAITGNLQ